MNPKTILNVFASISLSCFILGCHSNGEESLSSKSLREITSPAANGSFSPRVTSRSDGSVILSWLEPQKDTKTALRFSVWRKGAWSEPATIAAAEGHAVDFEIVQGPKGPQANNVTKIEEDSAV